MIIRRLLVIAGLGLLLPFLTYWIPNDYFTPIIEGVLALGLVCGVFMAMLFVLTGVVQVARGRW